MTSLLIDKFRRAISTGAYSPDISICAYRRGGIICGAIGYNEQQNRHDMRHLIYNTPCKTHVIT